MDEILVSACILVGAGFIFTGAVGLLSLPDFFSRLHGPTKASTLGVGATLVASILYFALLQGEVSARELPIALFLFLTAPVSAHLMARAALHLAVDSVTGMPDDPATHLAGYRREAEPVGADADELAAEHDGSPEEREPGDE